ncbi:hypothetical protein SDC9_191665 [bioreactor metagenome]|uniref:Uncharacterized protein n=1 Tax=bioreactor metagenome TaxID=1076179 RepID=A0A645I6S9_9ZZZZ
MRLQPFRAGKHRDGRAQFRERLFREVGILRPLYKIVHAKRTRKPRGAARRQGMVRPREIISQRLRAVVAKKDGARVLHIRETPLRLGNTEFEVLRREFVDKVKRAKQIVCHDDLAVLLNRRAGNLLARKRFELPLNLRADLLGKIVAVGNQHGGRQLVVFRLT